MTSYIYTTSKPNFTSYGKWARERKKITSKKCWNQVTMRVVDFIFKSSAFNREMRFNLVDIHFFFADFGLFVIRRYVIDVNECLIFITWNIIKIQIDVLVEFRRNIHSVYIFNLPMLINNRYHWKHMVLRRDSCIELVAFDTTPPSLLILILFSLKKCWNSRKTCKNTHTHARSLRV